VALLKILAASALMAATAVATERQVALWLAPRELVSQVLAVGSAIAVGLVVLAMSARVLGIEELDEALSRVAARLGRTGRHGSAS